MTLAIYEPSPESFDQHRTRIIPRLLALLLFLIAGFLMFVGISSFVGAYIRSSDMPDGFAWRPLSDRVSSRDLDPATALIVLTGAPVDEALNQTFDSGDLESTFALVAYDPRISDTSRVGALLQLGSQYASARNLRRSAWCYQAAAMLATLSPIFSDVSRSETLVTASTGLREADAKEAARRVIDQAYLIVLYSPSIRRQQRVSRLNQIASVYEDLNLQGISEQARSKAQEIGNAPETQPPPLRPPFLPIPGSLPSSPTLAETRHRRAVAAAQLQEDVSSSKPRSPTDWPQDSLNQLRYALLSEDDARNEYYSQQLPAARDSFAQIAVLNDKVDWLALKYRIARGGFGTSIVPEWAKNTNAIYDDLSDTWNELFDVFQKQTNALSNLQDVNLAREDIIRQELIGTRWGWSQRLESDLVASLADVTTKLHDSSVLALRLDTATRNNRTLYMLVPDELYGQGARVFPQ